MTVNRSMPAATVIPELGYSDVTAADWLCRAFGFSVRLRIADHRVQLSIGDGAMVVTGHVGARSASDAVLSGHAVMVRIADVHEHHATAVRCGARILSPPADYPYGERQYTVADPGGHVWTFSQSIADVDPADWGGELGDFSERLR